MAKQTLFGGRAQRAAEKQRLQDLFDLLVSEATSWAIFELDARGRVANWNSGAQRLTGYAAEEIVGHDFSLLFSARDLENGKPAVELKQAVAQGRSEAEGCTVRKDGSIFWTRAALMALRDPNGALYGFARVLQDLTRPKAEEAALQLCLEIWDNLPEGLLVFCPEEEPGGRSLRILAANTAVERMVRKGGPSLEELSGARWSDVSHAFPLLADLDITSIIWSVIASGEAKNAGQIRWQEERLPENVLALKAFPLSRRCAGLLFENFTGPGAASAPRRR